MEDEVKSEKKAVEYTDHGTYREHCAKCEHYNEPNRCEVVRGDVAPGGWCKKWLKENS
jgi:hypothetical protein